MLKLTMTTYRRPDYTEAALESIIAAEPWKHGFTRMLICSEPDQPEVASTLSRVLTPVCANMEVEIVINEKRLGCSGNTLRCFRLGFGGAAPAEFIAHLEDDVLVSPDAFRLARAFYDRGYKEGELSLNLLEPDCVEVENFRKQMPEAMNARYAVSSCIGMCFFVQSWKYYLRPTWCNMGPDVSWDIPIMDLCRKLGVLSWFPMYSRATHIGREEGQHCSPEVHDDLFGDHLYNEDPYSGPYEFQLNNFFGNKNRTRHLINKKLRK